ncbi:hypothetical protein TELCIR_15080, partial [Teladorsagia circumcincta]
MNITAKNSISHPGPMVVGTLADLLNTREDGLRLLLCVLAGYPLAVIHRTFFYNKPPNVQYAFFVVVGALLYIFNSGYDSIHCFIAIIMAYAITNFMGGTKESVIAAHVFFL